MSSGSRARWAAGRGSAAEEFGAPARGTCCRLSRRGIGRLDAAPTENRTRGGSGLARRRETSGRSGERRGRRLRRRRAVARRPSRSPSATRRWRASTGRVSTGVGIRVLVDGYWGFAATARTEDGRGRPDRPAGRRDRAGGRAASRASPSAWPRSSPSPRPGRRPMQEDPFTVPLEEKVALLMEAIAPHAGGRRRDVRRGAASTSSGGGRCSARSEGARDRTDGHALRRRDRGHRDRRRRDAAPFVPELVPRAHLGRGLGAHPRARAGRGGRTHRAPRPSSCSRAKECPSESTTLILDSRPGRSCRSTSRSGTRRARPRARHGGGLRGDVVPHDRTTAAASATAAR